jgi:hypothetical protein
VATRFSCTQSRVMSKRREQGRAAGSHRTGWLW